MKHSGPCQIEFIIKVFLINFWIFLVDVSCSSYKSESAATEEPFFPIGLFQVSQESFEKIKEKGFNVVHHYRFEGWIDGGYPTGSDDEAKAYLDKAHANGLKVLMGFDRYKIKNGDLTSVKSRVLALKGHPALLAWYLFDEPYGHGISVETCFEIYEIIKSWDSKHKVTMAISRQRNLEKYAPTTDVILAERYPIRTTYPVDRMNDVPKRVKHINQIASQLRNKRTQNLESWALIQAFGEDWDSLYRYPTFEQTRYMTYSAIINGSTGVFYWRFGTMSDEHFEYVLSPIVQELSSMNSVLLSPTIDIQSIIKYDTTGIEAVIKKWENDYYFIAANPKNTWREESFHLRVKTLVNDRIDVLFEKRNTSIVNDNWIDDFAGFDVHVYRLRG